MSSIALIILAGGKGTRIQAEGINKVMLPLLDKPLLAYTVESARSAGIDTIVIVVGHESESILSYFGDSVSYAHQREQIGTADALSVGVDALPPECTTFISVYGDDSYAYTPEIYHELIHTHKKTHAAITVLTVTVDNPEGLGRIVRTAEGSICGIVEDKDASPTQRRIKEINTGMYVFEKSFYTAYSNEITNENAAGEYYLTDIVDIAVRNDKIVSSVAKSHYFWHGINTKKQLADVQKKFKKQ